MVYSGAASKVHIVQKPIESTQVTLIRPLSFPFLSQQGRGLLRRHRLPVRALQQPLRLLHGRRLRPGACVCIRRSLARVCVRVCCCPWANRSASRSVTPTSTPHLIITRRQPSTRQTNRRIGAAAGPADLVRRVDTRAGGRLPGALLQELGGGPRHRGGLRAEGGAVGRGRGPQPPHGQARAPLRDGLCAPDGHRLQARLRRRDPESRHLHLPGAVVGLVKEKDDDQTKPCHRSIHFTTLISLHHTHHLHSHRC